MLTRTRLLLAILTAILVVAAITSVAQAGRLSVSDQTFRAVFAPLNFNSTEEGGIQARCNITLAGSFHRRTIAKLVNSLIATVTSAPIRECAGASVTILAASLPWHITYRGFTGALPNITGVELNLVGEASLISASIAECLYRSTTARPTVGTINVSAGRVTTITANESIPIPIARELNFFCFAAQQGFFQGTSGAVITSGGASITIRLI